MNRKSPRTEFALGALVRIGMACAFLITGGTGCQDIDWDSMFSRSMWTRSYKPIPPSHRSRKDKSRKDKSQQPAPADRGAKAKRAISGGGDLEQADTFYQVVLISEPASLDAPPDTKRIRLRRAQADPAARLLAMLYVPVGVGGGANQQYLIYQTLITWGAAARMAPSLDVKLAEDSVTRTPLRYQDAFRKGVALAMRALQPGQLDQAALTNAEACLKVVVVAQNAPAKLRWAAAVIAGKLLADLAFQFDKANDYFLLAQDYAPADSVEKMTTIYHHADALRQDGRNKDGVPLLRRVVRDFPMHSQTNVYQRCKRLASK